MSIANVPPASHGLPTHLDLPCKDDVPVDNDYQVLQTMLLRGSLHPYLDNVRPAGDYLIGSNMGIYWRLTDPWHKGCRAPDWYYVAGVPRLLDGQLRRSYVMWIEREPPTLVIEFLSETPGGERDTTPNTGKFWIYEQAIRARFYAIWDPFEEELEVYELKENGYRLLPPNANGRFSIPPMEIELGMWEGLYEGIPGLWLRGWDRLGALLATPEECEDAERRRADAERRRADTQTRYARTQARLAEEENQRAEAERQRAETERQRAETERQRAEVESQRADKLAERLRELGIDPNSL